MLLRLPWLWGRGPLQLGGLLGTQGQPSKCPAVGQACWIRAKAGHLLNLRLGSNELRLAVTPPLAVGPRSTPAGRTARHPGTTPKCPAVRQACLNRAKARHLTSYELRVTTCRYASLRCGAGVCSSWEDCPPPRDNPPSVQQSGRHAGTELRPGTFSPQETYDFGV